MKNRFQLVTTRVYVYFKANDKIHMDEPRLVVWF